MPVVCLERLDSRRETVSLDKSSDAIELHFVVLGVENGVYSFPEGTDNDDIVRAVVEATIPLRLFGLWALTYDIAYQGGHVWDVHVRYGVRPPGRPGNQPGDANVPDQHGNVASLTFSTTGGTAHISQALRGTAEGDIGERVYIRDGIGVVPKFHGAIGVTGDSVEGCDIVIPKFTFSETHYFHADDLTPEYKRNLFWLTGCVNKRRFRGFAPGEVLFEGVDGTRKGLVNWELVFRFQASPNVEDLEITEDLIVEYKDGWEYLWIRYEDHVNGKTLVKRPKAAVVNRVYRSADFALLNIGTF